MKSNAKGFLFYRESNNLGDYIQSIAAKKLIHERAVPIDREALNSYNGPITKLIMNGWFMENSKNWPPTDNIKPLIISFHINPIAVKNMLKPIGIAFFKKHEPIGCRDLYTQNVLTQHGVESYFSGCLTLTLKNKNKNKTGQGILVLGAIEQGWWLVVVSLAISSLLALIYVGRVIELIWFHEPEKDMIIVKDKLPKEMLIITIILTGATIYFGVDIRLTADLARVAVENVLLAGEVL